MIKKICAGVLFVLVKLYDLHAAYVLPQMGCCLSQYQNCGMTSSNSAYCSSWCRGRGYSYWAVMTISHICGYTNNPACVCFSASNHPSYDTCSCSGCYVGNGILEARNTSNGLITNFYCSSCQPKVCQGTYQDYTESTQRRAWQYCSASAGGCVIDSSYYDYRCNSGYYGEEKLKQTSPITCTKCASLYSVAATSNLGDNETIDKCYFKSGTVFMDTTGSFTFDSDCYYE